MLITMTVIGLVIAAIWFFAFNEKADRTARADRSDSSDSSAGDSVAEDQNSYEFGLSIDQQIDELFYYDPNMDGYVVVAGELEKQDTTIDELLQRSEISEKQRQRLTQIRLRNRRVLVEKQMFSSIDAADSMKSFEELAESLVNGQDETLKDLAGWSIAKMAATRLEHFTTEANAQRLIEELQKHNSAFVSNQNRAQVLFNQLMKTKRENPEKQFVGGCVQELGKVLIASSDDRIVELGNQVGQFSIFQDFDLATLENRIRYRGPNALQDLDNALRAIEANPDVETDVWKYVMRCYEASLSTKRITDFNTAQKIVDGLIGKIPDSNPMKGELSKLLKRQRRRFEKIGTRFEVSGMSVRGRKIDPSSSQYTLLVFCNRSPYSAEIMGELMKSSVDSGGAFRSIICFKDPFTDDDLGRLDAIPLWINVASDEMASRHVEAFEIDNFPYTFLINMKGEVIEANLSIVQTRNRIAAIEKKQREAKSGSPTSPASSN
jgi:hypothetical protein